MYNDSQAKQSETLQLEAGSSDSSDSSGSSGSSDSSDSSACLHVRRADLHPVCTRAL